MPLEFNVASDFAGSLQNMSTSDKTLLAGWAQTASLRRGKMMEIAVGPVGNPVNQDCNIIYSVKRQTADGTGTSATPVLVDAIEAGTPPSPGSAWKANYTVQGTYTDRVWTKWLNQHSAFIWYAPDDRGLPWPAVNNNGLALMARGATADYTTTVAGEARFHEL